MATTDLFASVLWNDGEAIVYSDFNDEQRFLGARLFDQLLQKLAYGLGRDPTMNGQAGTDISTAYAFALSPGSAYLRNGSANNKVQVAPGTLLQKVAASDGSEAKLLAYTFVGTEEVAIGNGAGAGLWRIDLVQMKLEYVAADLQSRDFTDAITGAPSTALLNKKRRVQCTLSLKVGTGAALSSTPTMPTADAGYVAIAAILVPPTYAGGAWNANGAGFLDVATASSLLCYDLRMPLCVRPFVVHPAHFQYSGAQCALDTFKQELTVTSGPATVYVPCPTTQGRIVGVGICGLASSGPTFKLASYSDGPGGAIVNNMNSCLGNLGGSSTFITDTRGQVSCFEDTHAPWTGPTLSGPVPVWANGARGPMEQLRLASGPQLSMAAIAVSALPTSAQLGPAIFWVAQGL